jgi:hypothetical protein
MKRTIFSAAALILLTLFAACGTQNAAASKVNLQLVQLIGPSDLGTGSLGGPMSMQYQLYIENKSDEPITLRQVQLQTPSPGAYALRNIPNFFKQSIGAGQRGTVTFWVPGVARGGISGNEEPVTIRGLVYFEAPSGDFQQVFLQTLGQFSNRF